MKAKTVEDIKNILQDMVCDYDELWRESDFAKEGEAKFNPSVILSGITRRLEHLVKLIDSQSSMK